jgi:DNA gyrase/topoisomerase IV subunit A
MKNKITKLSTLAERDWKEYALYTLYHRAIPSMVDGLKPSQRFILYSALKSAKDKFIKVAEIAGNVSSYGYHHGETSAQDAATAMAALWSNNVPLLEGDGNFGTRLIQKASAARYIYAKLHKNFNDLFMDTELCPVHNDPDVKIPMYYLPIIPMVLLNGVEGMATGFATNILPYHPKDVTKLTMDYLSGKNIDSKSLIPTYPDYKGTIVPNAKGGYDMLGVYELKSKTKLIITEIPYFFSRESYVIYLDSLEEKEIIVGYDEEHNEEGFKFVINLRRNFDSDIIKTFKLKTTVTENLTVIDHNGKLAEYTTPIALIKDFCDFRVTYVQARLDKEINTLTKDMSLLKSKIKFIELVLKGNIDFKQKSKKVLVADLGTLKFPEDHIDPLLSMNFYQLTTDEIDKLSDKYLSLNDRLMYCRETTAEVEYGMNLVSLMKTFK